MPDKVKDKLLWIVIIILAVIGLAILGAISFALVWVTPSQAHPGRTDSSGQNDRH